MGFDSMIIRVSKPTGFDTSKVYSFNDIWKDGLAFKKISKENEGLFRDIRPYSITVKIRERHIMSEEIGRAYNIENIFAYLKTDESIEVYSSSDKMLVIPQEDTLRFIKEQVEDYCIACKEEVVYWRRNYELSEFMGKYIDYIENGGYYILRKNVIEAYNKKAAYKGWTQIPVEIPTEASALFYTENY